MKASTNKLQRKRNSAGDDFFRAMIDGMQCGIISIDTSGTVIKINEIAKQILDVGRDEPSRLKKDSLEGQHISQALASHTDLANLMIESFRMSTLPNRDEMEISTQAKTRKKIGFSLSLVKNNEGKKIGCSIFFKDLTKIEERAEQEQLQERLAALGHMSASLAHELKNPLAAIEVNASFLRRKIKDDAEAQRILDGIISDINRLTTTINESLSFVRPLDLNLSLSRIESIVDKAIASVITQDDLRKIMIEKRYEDDLQPFLLDQELMLKALINIFKNAREACEDRGFIGIDLKSTGYDRDSVRKDAHAGESTRMNMPVYAVIRIHDNGKGIPKEVIDKIFYPFFTTKDQGSGLGLSFTKKVIDAHRGIIDVESRIGSGTTFTIQVPMHSSRG